MSSISNSLSRTSNLMMGDNLLSALQQTQSALLTTQNQISTGKTVSVPSDAPSTIAAILMLQKNIADQAQVQSNLTSASDILNNTDQGLSDASGVLVQAASLAESQIGASSDAGTRSAQVAVVNSQLQSLLAVANRTVQNVPLFGGNALGGSASQPFVSFMGGIRYVGSTQNLGTSVGLDQPLAYNSNGQESFNAVAVIPGTTDLNPQATAGTYLSNLNGAQAQGIRNGTVVLTVNGTSVGVDLSKAQTMGDVATTLNNAINAISPGAGSLAVSGSGFTLTAASGDTVGIGEVGSGQTAADLGIDTSATSGTVTGGDVDPRLTLQTTLASLGVPVDLTDGLKITQGSTTKVVSFAGDTTIQDMINSVNQAGMGVQMEINQDGTGLNLVDQVSGLNFSVGESNGGTTATDLGLRTFSDSTTLASLNGGLGVDSTPGSPDFEVDLHNGSTFQVELDGATTIQDVITQISTAAKAAGLTVGSPGATGTDFNIGLAGDGNGLSLEDNTTGAGDFKVVQMGQSLAATDLGIYTNAGTASSIAGRDVAMVQVDSPFTHLMNLSAALANNDSSGITLAGQALQTDNNNVNIALADVGVREQSATQLQSLTQDQTTSNQSMLSNLQDTDMASAITTFTQLQQQYEAALQVGAQNLQLSLLNYLAIG